MKRVMTGCFRKVFLRETGIFFSRPIYLFCSVVAPLGTFALFAVLMDAGLPCELPVAVVDSDNTSFTRGVTRYLDALQQSGLKARYANEGEAAAAMRRGDIYAFYYFPRGTTAALFTGGRPTLSFYMNYDYLVAGSLTYRDMRITSEMAKAGIGRAALLARGASNREAAAFLQPVVIDTHPIGNPWLSYSIYLNNTLMPGVMSLLIFLLTAFSVTNEIKNGTGSEWLSAAGGNIVTAVAGKLAPQWLLFALTAVFYNVYLYIYLGFPAHDGLWSMLLVSCIMVTASQGLGLFLACLLPSPRWAMSLASLWGVVSFSISGFSFPVEGMSGAINALTNLFPLRHYFMIYYNQALMGFPIAECGIHYAALLLFAALPLPLLPRLKKALLTYPYIE